MRRAGGIILLSFLPAIILACQPEQTDPLLVFCEDAIKTAIRTPATYERVGFSTSSEPGDLTAGIMFDAQNLHGAVVRSSAVCKFSDRLDLVEMTLDGKKIEKR